MPAEIVIRPIHDLSAETETYQRTAGERAVCSPIYASTSMQRSMNVFVSAVVILAWATGCATAARQPRPGLGRLTVGVTGSGGSASTLMLNIAVESTSIGGSVKAYAGLFTSNDVPFGTHVVRLTGVPSSCRVDNGSERKITLNEQRRSAVLRLDVRCD